MDLSDQYFLDKFKKLAAEVITSLKDTTSDLLANAKSHMIEQNAAHANDSTWNSNRKNVISFYNNAYIFSVVNIQCQQMRCRKHFLLN